MTLANKITISRILLIPVFITMAIYYGESIREGEPVELYRYLAAILFLLTALSDGLDGFVARRFKQKTRLGAILDPLADKALLTSGLVVLTLSPWPNSFPLWFPVLVISRDVVIVAGAVLIQLLAGHVEVRPSWTGKVATFFQMAAVVWVLFQIELLSLYYMVIPASLFTLVSGLIYLRDGVTLLQNSGHGQSE